MKELFQASWHTQGVLPYETLEYRGVDYSENVWKYIHRDISNTFKCIYNFRSIATGILAGIKIGHMGAIIFSFRCTIRRMRWIVYKIQFSDMEKHTSAQKIHEFIEIFAQYFNEKVAVDTYLSPPFL